MVVIYSSSGWNGFVYVLKGRGKFGGPEQWTESTSHHILVLGPGDYIRIKNEVSSPINTSKHLLKVVVICGAKHKVLNEMYFNTIM